MTTTTPRTKLRFLVLSGMFLAGLGGVFVADVWKMFGTFLWVGGCGF